MDPLHQVSISNSHSSAMDLREYLLCICNAKGTVQGAHSASTARIPGFHFPFLCSTNKQLMYWIYSTSVHLRCISHQRVKKLTLLQVHSIHFWATEQNISVTNTWNWVHLHLIHQPTNALSKIQFVTSMKFLHVLGLECHPQEVL
jgi:hypothetical protein